MIIEILVFLLGVHLTMMLLAALYGFVDLWYCIDTQWKLLCPRLSGLIGLNIIVALVLSEELRDSLFYGQLFYLIFHVAIFWLAQWGLSFALYKRRRNNL